jgi:hypothetical protein
MNWWKKLPTFWVKIEIKFTFLSSIPSSVRDAVAHLYKEQHENEALFKHFPAVFLNYVVGSSTLFSYALYIFKR